MIEVESLVQCIRDFQGKEFNPAGTLGASIANVVMNILYGRRFDHADPEFRKLLADLVVGLRGLSPELDIFPVLRYLPYNKNKVLVVSTAIREIQQFSERKMTVTQQVSSSVL